MSDFRNDPSFVRNGMNEVDSRVQWAAVAVILSICGVVVAIVHLTMPQESSDRLTWWRDFRSRRHRAPDEGNHH